MRGLILSLTIPGLLVLAAAAPVPHAPSSTQPVDVTAALDAGTSLALVQITTVKDQDNRAADGDRANLISYTLVKSSGKPPASLRVVTANPYPQMAGAPAAPEPTGILIPNPLIPGQRYWIVFSTNKKKYPQGVVAFYPEKDAPAALDAAITAKKYDK